MVKTVILSKAFLLYMKRRRKTWKISFTFLVVFRASGAPHVRTPCTSANWTLADRGAHVPCLIYCHIIGSKSGCVRSQEIPWCFASEGHHWGCCSSGVDSLTDRNWTSVLAVIYYYTLCMCIYAYFKKLWGFISWFNANSPFCAAAACYSCPYSCKYLYLL